MAAYLFVLALCVIPLTVAGGGLLAAYRLVRRLVTLRAAAFTTSAKQARPGDRIEAHARVVPRSSRTVTVQAQLTCTMFDHKGHELYASSRVMKASPAKEHEYSASLKLPTYALRTGLVGDKSPNTDERSRRMLVVWTVDFEVRAANGVVLYRKSRGLDVPRGRRPKTRLRRMSLLAIDTFSSVRNDMLFNWLVHLAACDGAITPDERRGLHTILDEMKGMIGDEEADARIEQELQRRLVIDDVFLQRYVPVEARLEFYRALYSLARRDGVLDPREQEFLADALKVFGLTRDDAKQMEGDAPDEAAPDQPMD